MDDTGTSRPHDAQTLLDRLEADDIERLWIVFHDYSGRSAGKIIPRASIPDAVRSGVVFAKANLDHDRGDQQASGATWLASSGDFLAVPDPNSYALLPQFPNTARVHAFLCTDLSETWDGCPRTRLAAMMDRARDAGFSFQVALEPEFYLTVRGEDGRHRPINAAPMYSTAGLAAEEPILRRILDLLRGMGVQVPQLGKEYSHGQYEVSTEHADPVAAVDNYYAVRDAVRDAASEFGVEATFMPKPYSEWLGNSMHVHLSVWNEDGSTDLTPAPTDDTTISETARHFLGGILAHIDALTGLGSPSVNSYKRLQPGTWAPGHAYWGYGNRSGVARIPGPGSRRHIEYRASDNSAQPELFLTGLLAAGMHGIQEAIDPGEPFSGDVGHMSPEQIAAAGLRDLPRSLDVALGALEHDAVIAEAIGDTALPRFLALRRNELHRYQIEVHDWERETWFAID